MGLPTLGCKAGVGEGGTDCKAGVGEGGADCTDCTEVLCIFTVNCDGVSQSREREAYVRRRGIPNTKSTINEILTE